MKLEKRHLYLLVVLFIALIVWQVGIVTARGMFRRYDRGIRKKQKDLNQIQLLNQEYKELEQTLGEMTISLKKREKEYTPFSYLQMLSQRLGVRDKLNYRGLRDLKGEDRYKQSSVGVELIGISMERLLDYLYQVENSGELLTVGKLHISPLEDKSLNVSFEVSTLVPVRDD